MKKIILFILGLCCGTGLILFHERIGSGLDDIFLEPQTLPLRANQFLVEGRLHEYEGTLKEIVLDTSGSEKNRATAFYNLAACALEKASRGNPTAGEDALFYLREALRNDPSLFPAKYNLELLDRRTQVLKQKQAGNISGHSEMEESNPSVGRLPTQTPPHLGDNP